MTLRNPSPMLRLGGLVGATAFVFAACAGTGGPATGSPSSAVAATPGASNSAQPDSNATPPAGASAGPEASTRTAAGDVPDNAVYLTYRDAGHAFSIKYVEGWQVVPNADGVVIRDKDSSETVATTSLPTDVSAWVAGTDLPTLKATAGFSLMKQDTVKVGSSTLIHLVYHMPAPPDPVTGKQISSTVDRYYVPGASNLAIVSLSTPDGVDNVDAFRLLIESFSWQ